MVVMEADMCAGVGDGSDFETETPHWHNLVVEFADVFELPRMPT